MKSLENIASEALLLPKDQRFTLAHRILSSVEPEVEPEVEPAAAAVSLALPFARRDLDRLRLILAAQPRLREIHRSGRVRQMLAGRGYLDEALR